MLATAQHKAPHLTWLLEDLAVVAVGRLFDVVLLAGNVLLFVDPGTEAVVLRNMARHLQPRGVMIAGFQLTSRLTIEGYDALAAAVGLQSVERWSTWACAAWTPGSDYVVSVHRIHA